jgi:hypothetical protein
MENKVEEWWQSYEIAGNEYRVTTALREQMLWNEQSWAASDERLSR